MQQPTDDELTPEERAERQARRDATRAQIVRDQQSGAKRDPEALRREAEWHRKNGGQR